MPSLFDNYTDLDRSAEISDCGQYRWWLSRRWRQGGNGKVVCFVMLNPSTADGSVDDPTIRRCLGFTKSWGYSGLMVRNLFAYRATDPGELLRVADPIGPLGNRYLQEAEQSDLVIAAWGADVPFGRDLRARELLAGAKLFCLEKTKHGMPRHPLYARGDLQPVPF